MGEPVGGAARKFGAGLVAEVQGFEGVEGVVAVEEGAGEFVCFGVEA